MVIFIPNEPFKSAGAVERPVRVVAFVVVASVIFRIGVVAPA